MHNLHFGMYSLHTLFIDALIPFFCLMNSLFHITHSTPFSASFIYSPLHVHIISQDLRGVSLQASIFNFNFFPLALDENWASLECLYNRFLLPSFEASLRPWNASSNTWTYSRCPASYRKSYLNTPQS